MEPYRQRLLLERLEASKCQVFITTHSPSAIAVSKAALWYVDHAGRIGPLQGSAIVRHRAKDPLAFLSRLAIIGEGVTEVGFVKALLDKAVGSLQQHGIHVSDGGGHDNVVDLLQALAAGGLRFGGFADDEGRHPDRWAKIAASLGPLLFRWKAGCLDQNIIGAVSDDNLEALLTDPDGDKTSRRLRTLKERLDTPEKDFATLRAKAGTGLKAVIIEAALGTVPSGKEDEKKHFEAHAQTWFKTVGGGRELAGKVFSLGLWPIFKAQFMPFCNAVRKAVDLPERADLLP